jgi:hypothetical protein
MKKAMNNLLLKEVKMLQVACIAQLKNAGITIITTTSTMSYSNIRIIDNSNLIQIPKQWLLTRWEVLLGHLVIQFKVMSMVVQSL